MSISSRIYDTIEQWQAEWKDRLRGWMASWVEKGIVTLFDLFEPELIEEVRVGLSRIREIPDLPDDQKDIIDKALNPTGAFQFAAVLPYLIGIMIGFGMGSARPAMNIGSYQIDKLMKSYRLDPFQVITAWRRDKPKYEKLFDDLKDQGWNDERIEALKFFTLYYPSPAELIHWTAREVFEPDMVAKYGLGAGKERLRREDFYKAGMDDEQIDNHWIAHWEHASFMQMIEMLHRKIITEQDVKDWFPLVEMAPYWADNLIKMMYTWPTRVDVRRWWDMRTIDESRLRELYEGMGYRGKDLEDYIKWTKVYVDFPIKMAHFTNGWITEDDIRDWLRRLEIPDSRIEAFIKEKTKPAKPERVAADKDLTMALIVEGVKKGVISESEGVEQLMRLGYDEFEADYIITVRLATVTGSPETVEEFRDITEKWRAATGIPAKPVSEELKKAAAELVRLTKDVEVLRQAEKEELAQLVPEGEAPETAKVKLKEIRLELHRAEAELFAAKTDYDSLLAQWKHQEEK